jgi:epoxyqueuosine reductase
VCPWNRRRAPAREPALAPAGRFPSPAELLALDADAFGARFRGRALRRARRSGLLRNAALVLGNERDPRAAPALARAARDEDPVVRDAAAWALARLSAGPGRGMLAS